MELTRGTIIKIVLIITFTVVLLVGLLNIGVVMTGLNALIQLLMPFITGISLAFILNVLMVHVESLLDKLGKKKNLKFYKKLIRGLALVMTLTIVFTLVVMFFFLVIPEFKRTIETVVSYLPDFAIKAETWLGQQLSALPVEVEKLPKFEMDWKDMGAQISRFLGEGSYTLFSTTVGITSTIFGGLINLLIGLVLAIYILAQKETLSRQSIALLTAFLSKNQVESILKVGRLSYAVFSNFVAGQFFEAVLIGVLCFVGMLIFGMPYALVISVLVAVTALIPIFGALIGTAAGAFLILMVNPVQALWFVVYIVVLQQLEGNLIYPKLVGDSIGLPGIWVLVSVTLGGSAFGIPGMLIGVPLTSVCYALLKEEVKRRNGEL